MGYLPDYERSYPLGHYLGYLPISHVRDFFSRTEAGSSERLSCVRDENSAIGDLCKGTYHSGVPLYRPLIEEFVNSWRLRTSSLTLINHLTCLRIQQTWRHVDANIGFP